MQLATIHTADEISFLKRLLDAMFETYNTTRQEVLAITSMQAMKLAKAPNEERRETQNGTNTQGSSGQGLTLLQAEKMLKTLVEEGWFEKSRKGYYSLSPRALMELRGWLFETYNDPGSDDEDDAEERVLKVKVCVACKEIITSVSISRLRMNARFSFSTRVKDARGSLVHADCTIFVPRISSAYKSRLSAHCAGKSGRAIHSSGNAQSPLQIRGERTNEEVVHHRGGNRLSLWKDRTRLGDKRSNRIGKRRNKRTKKLEVGSSSSSVRCPPA